jgi:hypothetical protein
MIIISLEIYSIIHLRRSAIPRIFRGENSGCHFQGRMNKAEGKGMIKEEGGPEGDGKNQLILDTSIFQPLERHCRHMQRNKHEQQMS